MSKSIDDILGNKPHDASAKGDTEESKFFSILVGEGVTEQFLELRFKDGGHLCISYDDLSWFDYDPKEGRIGLDFGGFPVEVRGRGLGDRVFNGFRQKRVAWIKEADTTMQDHPGNSVYIQSITFPVDKDEEAKSEK
jgi:hypothetical protein